jgi:hypothetical protein
MITNEVKQEVGRTGLWPRVAVVDEEENIIEAHTT